MELTLPKRLIYPATIIAAFTLAGGLVCAPASATTHADPPTDTSVETPGEPVLEQTEGEEPLTAEERAKLLADAASCGTVLRKFWVFGNWIYGDGTFTRCGPYWKATAHIERSRWYGWESMKSRSRQTTGSVYLAYNCSGTGTHTFRYRISTNWSSMGKTGIITLYSKKISQSCTG